MQVCSDLKQKNIEIEKKNEELLSYIEENKNKEQQYLEQQKLAKDKVEGLLNKLSAFLE